MAKLKISKKQCGDATVLFLDGDITFGEGNLTLRTEVRRLLSEGKKKIFLDFAAVGYLDSSGVGELVSAFTAIDRENGQLKLVNLPPRSRELLMVCKLLTVFDVCQGDAEALVTGA